MDKLTLLSQISLFEELSQEELMRIDQMSEMSPVKKGTTIVSPENTMNALFLLKKGQVRLYRMNEEGKQFTLDILVDGNIFGETSTVSLTDDQTYAEAMTDTYICTLSHRDYEEFIKKNPHVALKLIDILSSRLKDFYSLSEKIALSDVKHRLLYLLLMLSQKTGRRKQNWQTIEMKLTHQDLANMIGTTRETTSAIMSELKKDGFIRKVRFLAIDADKTQEFLNLS
ncbi:Crp/Fnr family transcriptional regulator [Halobacillus halophilus]|uniref:CRP/FNR family transcription regulator n=1 Tax=Halobacillus halophilus (strain ATCC 35676 / DSM 2266 / JCM 20832 / KCTC 3685 / LMG 17431 / NBRC 102448 / NCIMB 2269) TaxID=866895 RepID=I0JKW5_HALH3|nr:Crp/Fnr family transcriptional regulator [Halobacillus halophilus]ASF38911.1 Crp/Fnr family transcriptional regulator [Halobacillus halophilus]CCG44785.1 CRP/FNR family transcription regulator [Halobacillus halophilus DSM 2266]